jgi:hypothetical protein
VSGRLAARTTISVIATKSKRLMQLLVGPLPVNIAPSNPAARNEQSDRRTCEEQT